jgi:hypothetical protein
MQTRFPMVVLVALLGTQAWSQTTETLPPIAGPPAAQPRGQPYPAQPWSPPPATYQGQLPPPVPFQPGPDQRHSVPVPPAPTARELQAREEPVRLRWRTAIEAEFAESWGDMDAFLTPGATRRGSTCWLTGSALLRNGSSILSMTWLWSGWNFMTRPEPNSAGSWATPRTGLPT